jgi:hypothetical protein
MIVSSCAFSSADRSAVYFALDRISIKACAGYAHEPSLAPISEMTTVSPLYNCRTQRQTQHGPRSELEATATWCVVRGSAVRLSCVESDARGRCFEQGSSGRDGKQRYTIATHPVHHSQRLERFVRLPREP